MIFKEIQIMVIRYLGEKMSRLIMIKNKSAIIKKIIKALKNDFVFTAALTLALISCFFATPKIKYIDFKVIISLFNLMLVIKAFEELKILDKAAVSLITRCKNKRSISLALTFLCFFSSMLITNDVALITFVPLALIIGKKTGIPMLETIILQTLAANIGSSLTPMGNPQNLYIFSFYNLTAMQFFQTMIIIGILGLAWLYLLNMKLKNDTIKVYFNKVNIVNRRKLLICILLFLIIILSIFRFIDYRIAFAITIIAAFIMDRKLFSKVDYLLLVTFICFFIFIGNASSIKSIDDFFINHLHSSRAAYFSSIVVSQFISNVPCSILLSHFTNNWKALLLGVNIGGSGTIIASLASVISYKLFIKDNLQNSKLYFAKFTIYNFITLFIFAIIGLFVI